MLPTSPLGAAVDPSKTMLVPDTPRPLPFSGDWSTPSSLLKRKDDEANTVFSIHTTFSTLLISFLQYQNYLAAITPLFSSYTTEICLFIAEGDISGGYAFVVFSWIAFGKQCLDSSPIRSRRK